MNFRSSYAMPEGEKLAHTVLTSFEDSSHEDGYLCGVRSLLQVMRAVCTQLDPAFVSTPAPSPADEGTPPAHAKRAPGMLRRN